LLILTPEYGLPRKAALIALHESLEWHPRPLFGECAHGEV
jgi:hypothetical protein